jgi:hypothetical protein
MPKALDRIIKNGVPEPIAIKAANAVIAAINMNQLLSWRRHVRAADLVDMGLTGAEAILVYNAMWKRRTDTYRKRKRAAPRDDEHNSDEDTMFRTDLGVPDDERDETIKST